MIRKIELLIGTVALIVGCSKEPNKPGVYVEADHPMTFFQMSDGDVFVKINGIPLTKGLYQTFCDLKEKIYRLHSAIALDCVSEKADRYRRCNEQRWYEELIRRELMRQEADRCGIQAPTGKLAAAESQLMTLVRMRGKDFEVLTNSLNASEFALLRANVREDVRSDLLRKKAATNDFEKVSEAEIDKRISDVKAFNARADKLNERARKKGLQFKSDVLAGKGKFPALTSKYGEVHPEFGAKWDDVQIGEFPEDSPLRTWLKTAQPGDLSDPIDLDDGLAVVGYVAKLDADVPKGMPPVSLYRLVRCTFRAYEKMEEKSRDEVRKFLLQEKKEAVQRELGSRIFDAAVIEFPHGTNLFPPVKSGGAPKFLGVSPTNSVPQKK